VPKIETPLSLIVIASILVISTVASLIKVKQDPSAKAHAGKIRGDKKEKESK
jgi:tellurite resistance protein TerC